MMASHRSKTPLIALVLLSLACSDAPAPGDAPGNAPDGEPTGGVADTPGDTGPTGFDTAQSGLAGIIARKRASLPPGLLVREGACPFECCQYGEWTAVTPIPLVASVGDEAPAIDTIQPGQAFTALGGQVRVTGIELVIVTDTVAVRAVNVADTTFPPTLFERTFAPGDTLVVLDYVAEGNYNVWVDGEVLEFGRFWSREGERVVGPNAPGRGIGEHTTEWWVRVRTEAGRTAWFEADASVDFCGADACGMCQPPES